MEYTGEDNLKVMKSALNYNKHLIDLVRGAMPQNAKTILDFGSGDAFFANELKKQLNAEIYCVEPAANMQKFYAQKPYQSLSEVKSDSIDYIYSLNVLEHIEKDEDIVAEFHRVLTSKGVVFLYLPAFMCLYSAMDDLVGHYRRYQKNDVSRLFNMQKWQVETVRYADFAGFFATLAYKLIGNRKGTLSTASLTFYDKYLFLLSAWLDKITAGRLLGKNIIIKVRKI